MKDNQEITGVTAISSSIEESEGKGSGMTKALLTRAKEENERID